jgi:hypothetical protein
LSLLFHFIVADQRESLQHSVQRSSVDAQNLGGTLSVLAHGLENMNDVPTLDFIQGREAFEQAVKSRLLLMADLRHRLGGPG